VLTRHGDLGRPAPPQGIAAWDDEKLQSSILDAARKLSEIRGKEAPQTPPAAEERPYKMVKGKNGKMHKVYQPYLQPPPEGWQPKDPANPTPEEQRRLQGFPPEPDRPVVPPSAERVAAEKEFFALLVESLRRGNRLRDPALTRGYASVIFR
jgi:hypothetical protein